MSNEEYLKQIAANTAQADAEMMRQLQECAQRAKREAWVSIPLQPTIPTIPGNYAYWLKSGDSEVMLTFQTLQELQQYLKENR